MKKLVYPLNLLRGCPCIYLFRVFYKDSTNVITFAPFNNFFSLLFILLDELQLKYPIQLFSIKKKNYGKYKNKIVLGVIVKIKIAVLLLWFFKNFDKVYPFIIYVFFFEICTILSVFKQTKMLLSIRNVYNASSYLFMFELIEKIKLCTL